MTVGLILRNVYYSMSPGREVEHCLLSECCTYRYDLMTWCVINLKDNINIAFIFLKIKNAALTRLPV